MFFRHRAAAVWDSANEWTSLYASPWCCSSHVSQGNLNTVMVKMLKESYRKMPEIITGGRLSVTELMGLCFKMHHISVHS